MPTKLLIDEHPLLVLPSLAAAIGLPEAIFLQQLHYWIETSGHLQPDGQHWIHNTYEEWAEQFPWWNIGTIRRIVNTLRDRGLILTSRDWNRMAIDNTLWYTIHYPTLTALDTPPPDPQPHPAEDTPPPDPQPHPAEDTPDPVPPSAETNTPSAETNRPRAQNEQTTRAKIADHARKMRAPITRESNTKTTTETTTGGGGGQIPDPDLLDSEKKPRARPRATPPPTPTPQPDYPTANTHPPAIDTALLHAGILDPNTRASIFTANPALTVHHILAWNAYRAKFNTTAPTHRSMGAGALVSLLRTGANPPASTTDPTAAETWLIHNGFLPAPQPHPAEETPSPVTPPLPDPDPAAAAYWTQVCYEMQLSLQRSVYDNWLRNTVATAYDPATGSMTVTVPTVFAQEWLSQRMKGTLTQRLRRLANRTDITLHFTLPTPPPQTHPPP